MAKDTPSDTASTTPSDVIKSLWAPVAGFAGAVTLVMQLIELWKGDQASITYVSAGLGALAISCGLVWVGFSKKVEREQIHPGRSEIKRNWRYPKLYRWARIGLVLFLGVGSYGILAFSNHRQSLREKTVPLIAIFDGPEETYGVTNELLEQLDAAVMDYEDIQIIRLGKKITVEQGSEYARNMGKRYLADIVIWGWYRPTENPNITLHIENLAPTEIVNLNSSISLKPSVTLEDLSSFSIQQTLGEEMSSMVIFISAYGYFKAGDYQKALVRFEKALSNKKWSDDLVNRADILFYISLCHLMLGEYDKGIDNLDLLIQFNHTIAEAYHNRGVALLQISEYTKALADYNKAIQIEPDKAQTYYLRGLTFMQLGDYEKALHDYRQAIYINPTSAQAYYLRGLAFMELGDYEKAKQDFQLSLGFTTDPALRANIETKLQIIDRLVP